MPEPRQTPAAPFVTFYSFKGGVGRSLCLINTAGILVGRGFRVLVIDCDLEAPGLSYLNPAMPDNPNARTAPLRDGFVELLLDAKHRGQQADFFSLSMPDVIEKYTQKYTIPDGLGKFSDGSLRIMAAGRMDPEYAARLNELGLAALYHEGVGEPLIRAFKMRVVNSNLFDYVLIDSRTGFSDEAGICTRDLADHLVILSGLNRQNVEGTSGFLRTLRKATGNAKVSLQFVLTPIPTGEDALVDERIEKASAAFASAWGEQLPTDLQIPYHPHLALTEVPHIFRRRRGYLFDAYRAIEGRLLELLGQNAQREAKRAVDAIAARDADTAMGALRRGVRLDDGDRAVGIVARNLFTPEGIGELSRFPAFEPVYEFIADHMETQYIPWVTYALRSDKFPKLTDTLFRRYLATYPSDARQLCNYANILTDARKKHDMAEVHYRHAIELEPANPNILGGYANFLTAIRKEYDSAEQYYQRAIELGPENANVLGNYARLLLTIGRVEEGLRYVRSSIEKAGPDSPHELPAECQMYLYCCAPEEERSPALAHLKRLVLEEKIRTGEWSFEGVIERAVAMGHPESAWLPKLAAVVGGQEPPEVLAEWGAWAAV